MNPSSNHPRRRNDGSLNAVYLAAAVSFALSGLTHGQDPDVIVSSGSQVTLSVSGTYGRLTVTGTDAGGQASTFTADGPLVLTGSVYPTLSVTNGGIFNANAAVTMTYGGAAATVLNSGRLALNSGTFTASGLTVSGSGAIARTAGAYSVSALTLQNQASLTYTSADVVRQNSANDQIRLESGASFVLERDLVGKNVTMTGSTTALVRNGQSLTNSSLFIGGGGATLGLQPTDTLRTLRVGTDSSITLPTVEAMPTLSVSYRLDFWGGTIAGLESRPFNVEHLGIANGQTVTLRSGAITDTVSSAVWIQDSTLSIEHDVTLDRELWLDGPDALLNLNGHTITAYQLLLNGAEFTIDGLVNVTGFITLGDDVLSGSTSTAVARKPLSVNGVSITGDSTLSLLDFTGSGPDGLAWGLSVAGDKTSALDAWILAGNITGPASLGTVYNAGTNRTYVLLAAVPEPSAYAIALAGFGITGLARLIRRRQRDRASENS